MTALLIGGTASHVGKSWMATAVCRWLLREGWDVAPFKAQNMSNNSYPCAAGGEIGRAQVAQAQACRLDPEPDMNPILLKPDSDRGSQVVVNGKVWRTLSARDYYAQFPYLLTQVLEAYRRLASRHEVIVIEGAGSIAELNLKCTDLVNLGLAKRIGAPVMLVADIDRGGVFASVAGTFGLLEEDERAVVRGFAINRFRGDPALFADGAAMLEERTGAACLGVFPYLRDTPLDAEDAVSIEIGGHSDVAIIRLPHISNATDFRLLPDARWISQPVDQRFHCVIIPGTKNTVDDLEWLKRVGLANWIRDQRLIIGICGGYQMLGERVEDCAGLNLLPGYTVMHEEKTTRAVEARTPSGLQFSAYEIHMGETSRPPDAVPFAILADGTEDGVRSEHCVGTYLHGALEDPAVLGELLGREVAPAPAREDVYEALADWFDAHVDRRRFEELYLCA